MKRELLNIEGGKIKKGNNVIFDDLSLELFQGEITGIVFDDILEQKLFIDMLLGDVLLYSGKIFVNEERKAYEEAARLLKQQVAVIGSKSKLLPSITIEDNIFLFSDRKLFLDQKEYRERFQKLRTELNISDDMPHKVRNLSAKEKVIIELLKAYEERKKIVILDEITSLLSEKDLGEVFSLIDKMKSQMSFLVTVGFEDFIMEWMESIAVVQNGRTTFVSGISQLNCKLSKVLKALIYENKAETFGAYGQKVINGQNNVLEVRDVSTCYLKNLNFTLCSGELLKIYYSDEKSKSSFWEMFSGEESIEEGQIYISEKLYKVSNMSQAVREGVGFITEAPYLFKIIEKLKKKNTSIIYISHKMEEILRISDDVTVMRDGKWIDTKPASELTIDKIIKMMVGRELKDRYPEKKAKIGDVLMEVKDLGTLNPGFEGVNFQLHKGEILGIAGLVGSKRTEILETLFGIRMKGKGQILVKGKEVQNRSPKEAMANGFAMLTEERRSDGIFGGLSVGFNMTISNLPKYQKTGLLNGEKMKADITKMINAMKVKTPSMKSKIANLSGGNQQKVILGRWLLTDPDILLLDEPTRGIDVGAKFEIYQLINQLAEQGKGIIVVSSEMPELFGISDRILVMSNGHQSAIFDSKEVGQVDVMQAAARFI